MINYSGDELPQGIEIRKDGKVMTADEVVAELQAARAQQSGSGSDVPEVCTHGDPGDDLACEECAKVWSEDAKRNPYPVGEIQILLSGRDEIVSAFIYPDATVNSGQKLYTHPSASVPDREQIKSACTNFFYWWYNQPGSNTLQGFDEWFEEFGQYESTTTPQPADNWIKCSERLPTEADADDEGAKWFLRGNAMYREMWHHPEDLTEKEISETLWHESAGLTVPKRPNPPTEGAE